MTVTKRTIIVLFVTVNLSGFETDIVYIGIEWRIFWERVSTLLFRHSD